MVVNIGKSGCSIGTVGRHPVPLMTLHAGPSLRVVCGRNLMAGITTTHRHIQMMNHKLHKDYIGN